MPAPANQPDLFHETDDLLPRVEEAAAPGDSAPSALDEFFNRSSRDMKASLLRMLQKQPLAPNDPLLTIGSGILAKIDELIAALTSHSSEQEANLQAAALSAARSYEDLVSAETGATKYAARLHEITEETKAAVEVAQTHLNALVKIRATGGEAIKAAVNSALAGQLWKTAAGVIAADFAIRLLIAHL